MPVKTFFIFILSIITLAGCENKSLADNARFLSGKLDIKKLLAGQVVGTPARDENELKFAVAGPETILQNRSYVLRLLQAAFTRFFVNDLLWQAPSLLNRKYEVLPGGMGTFCFVDIYLDTPQQLNLKNNISYRVRYRWRSAGRLRRYMSGSTDVNDFPHRCEYQLKVYDKEWRDGFNVSRETRFEFRNESLPFKNDLSAPPAPWPFEEFVRPAITGSYAGHNINTGKAYAQILRDRALASQSVYLRPQLVLVTTRSRVHVGLPNEFGEQAARQGLGAIENARQTMLVTFDTSEVYAPDFFESYFFARQARKHNSLTPRLAKRLRRHQPPMRTFSEIEFEFERNVEALLTHEIETTKHPQQKARLKNIHAAILKDLRTLAEIAKTTLTGKNLKLEPGRASKYRQAAGL